MNDVLEPPDEQPALPAAAVQQRPSSTPLTGSGRAAAMDVAGFSAFYRAEVTALVNFLLWMGARAADAADLAQDTMIDAFRGWSQITHPRAWVRRVASRKYGRHFDRAAPGELPGDRNPLLATRDTFTDWEQHQEVLRRIAALPWRQRQVMAWSYDGYQPSEIAAELGITAEAVRSSLKDARRALAAALDQEGEPA